MATYNISRGFRNHNPLNIVRGTQWEGLSETQTDRKFCQFVSNAYGYRAAFITLRSYIDKHGCNSIRKIITRWAPPSDGNHTDIYIRKVSKISKVPVDDIVSMDNCVVMTAIVSAMAIIENGVTEIDVNEVKEGWRMANKK